MDFNKLLQPDHEADFMSALAHAQTENVPRSHEAVQAALDAVDPNFELVVTDDFEEACDIVSGLKSWLDSTNKWPAPQRQAS